MKALLVTLSVLSLTLLGALPAAAHVEVSPAEAETAAFQTFTISVPNEKDIPTIALRLVVPAELGFVSPTVKSGWNITTRKESDAEDARITEIIWAQGSIPAGQRDDFSFSAQLPAQPTSVAWKAYQTYQNGTIVSWDQNPADEEEGGTPYSETKVVATAAKDSPSQNTATTVSVVALVVALAALILSLRRR